MNWRRDWQNECQGLGLALTLVSPPAAQVLSTDEGRKQLRLTPTFGTSPPSHPEDGIVDRSIRAATQELEGPTGWLGRALVTQRWRMTLDRFPNRRLVIPLPPLQSVEAISYVDADGETQTVDPETYVVSNSFSLGSPVTATAEVGFVEPGYRLYWPRDARRSTGAVAVEFVAGYGDPEDVPDLIKQVIAVRLGFYFEHREWAVVGAGLAVQELSSYGGLLENFRVRGLM